MSAVVPVITGGRWAQNLTGGTFTGNVFTQSFPGGVAQPVSNNVAIVGFFVFEFVGTIAASDITATFAGLPCQVQLRAISGYTSDERCIVTLLCLPQATDTYTGNNFVVTVGGTTSYYGVYGGSGAVATGVLPTATLASSYVSTDSGSTITPNFSQTLPAVSGGNGDMLVSAEHVVQSSISPTLTVTSSPTFTSESNSTLSSGLPFSTAYRVLAASESDAVTWQFTSTQTIGSQVAAGLSFTLPTAATQVVPNVVGDTVPAASAALVGAGLVLGAVTYVTNAAPVGQVVSQSPTAGTTVVGGSAVAVSVSGVIVPSVFNLSVPAATTVLAAAGFTVGAIGHQYDVIVIPGNIDAQSPAAGSVAAPGSAVAVTLSAGRGPVVVPDILGDTATAANAAIVGIGLMVGAVSTQASLSVPAGEVVSQNPYYGTPVASGSIVSYVLSSGPPAPLLQFDVMATLISQFANSPTLLRLIQNMAAYIDQSQNFANFYNFVWNVDTAQGFGLDIWGKIVNVSRLLQIPITARYVGFQDGTGPGTGTDVEPFSEKGSWYVPAAATQSYLLQDGPYRQLILTKALANIVNTTVPAFNKLLQNLFPGRGNPYVVTSGTMAMTFYFDFALTPIELAILQQSGAVPVPPGVSFTIVTP